MYFWIVQIIENIGSDEGGWGGSGRGVSARIAAISVQKQSEEKRETFGDGEMKTQPSECNAFQQHQGGTGDLCGRIWAENILRIQPSRWSGEGDRTIQDLALVGRGHDQRVAGLANNLAQPGMTTLG